MEILPSEDASRKGTRDWPHAPPHRLGAAGIYFMTARCAEGARLLADDGMKDWFQDALFALAADFAAFDFSSGFFRDASFDNCFV